MKKRYARCHGVRGRLHWSQVCVFLLFYLFFSPSGACSQETATSQYVPGELLVKFRSHVSAQTRTTGHLPTASSTKTLSVKGNLERIALSPDMPVDDAVAFYNQMPEVEYAEPNYRRQAFLHPNDPGYYVLWGLHNIGQTGGKNDADLDAPPSWNVRTDSSAFTIAVLDTGADWDHEDLWDNIWNNTCETENGVDTDGNGYADDIIGWDFVNNDNDPNDDDVADYHGTHITGTIAATGNNGIGVTGISWSGSVMVLKMLDAGGAGTVADEIKAIDYAINNGAKIINASFGGVAYSAAEYEAISRARGAGVLFVAAAGNEGKDNDIVPAYPACHDLDNIIVVAASDERDNLASFSNYGITSVDVAAPGVSIYSTKGKDLYQYRSGTSMAAPFVSGLATLIWAENDTLTWSEVKDRVLAGVDTKKALTALVLTGGRINANKSVSLSPYVEKVNPGSCEPGSIIKIIGYHFGPDQEDSLVHIGGKVFDWASSRIKLWSDTKIKIRIPNYKCDAFRETNTNKKKVSITVDGIRSNKKKLKITRPQVCL